MGLFQKKTLNLTYATLLSPGNREYNEDGIAVSVDGTDACFVLADGLGGHGYGEVASEIACNNVISEYETMSDSASFFKASFENGQAKVTEAQNTNPEYNGMKTTLVVALLSDMVLQWGHIGDSRFYLFKNGKLQLHTLDHSLPQMLVYAKEIKEEDIRFHPDRNRLLRVIGAPWSAESYEISKKYPLKSGYSFLLCSDGFWEFITEKEMCEELKKAASVDAWLDAMKQIVEKNGKDKDMDNYSAICGWIR